MGAKLTNFWSFLFRSITGVYFFNYSLPYYWSVIYLLNFASFRIGQCLTIFNWKIPFFRENASVKQYFQKCTGRYNHVWRDSTTDVQIHRKMVSADVRPRQRRRRSRARRQQMRFEQRQKSGLETRRKYGDWTWLPFLWIKRERWFLTRLILSENTFRQFKYRERIHGLGPQYSREYASRAPSRCSRW